MWGRYKIEIQGPSEVHYLQQYMGRPSHYLMTPPHVAIDQPTMHLLAITDEEYDSSILDSDISCSPNGPSSSPHHINEYRTGSHESEFPECETANRGRLKTISNHATSDDEL